MSIGQTLLVEINKRDPIQWESLYDWFLGHLFLGIIYFGVIFLVGALMVAYIVGTLEAIQPSLEALP